MKMIWIEVQSSRFPRERGQNGFQLHQLAHLQHLLRGSIAGLWRRWAGVADSSGENSFSNFTPNVSDRQEVSHMDLRQRSPCWVSSNGWNLMTSIKMSSGSGKSGSDEANSVPLLLWKQVLLLRASVCRVKRFIPWMEWHSAGSRVDRTLSRWRLGSAELP